MGEAVSAAAILSDPTRASILRMLATGPICVCELATALGLRENNVSNHLARLRLAGLVRASRHQANARFQYYERDEAAVARARAVLDDVLGERLRDGSLGPREPEPKAAAPSTLTRCAG